MNCYQISSDLHLLPCDFEQAVGSGHAPPAPLWVDAQEVEQGALEQELTTLGVTGLARRLCLEARDRPGIYPMKALTFLVIPVHPPRESPRIVGHVALLYRDNLLLTLRDARGTDGEYDLLIQESAAWLPGNSIAGLVSGLMIALSLASLRESARLSDTIQGLEERMDDAPDSVEMEEISRARSELLALESAVSGQVPIVQALVAIDRAPATSDGTPAYLAFGLSNLQAAAQSLSWLEGRIDVLRSLAEAHAQDNLNRRLGRLTILSIIFMPLTLLAGIWGMNFAHMPELALPLGYPVALGVMLLIGAGMYLYFRDRGWFE